VAPEALLPRCLEIAAGIAAKGPVAVSFCKLAVNHGGEMSQSLGLSYEVELFAQTFATQDQKEGMQAFIEKRAPRFRGE
jgi:enoyl-CoA hydratase/carnithine racemase